MIRYEKLLIYSVIPSVLIAAFLVNAMTNKEEPGLTATKEGITFTCSQDEYNGQMVPATVVNKPKSKTQTTIISWKPDNYYFGEKWSPEERCKEVAQRFQRIHNRDGLKYVVAEVDTWVPDRDINVVCAVKNKNAVCNEDDLLFTLEGKDNPNNVLRDLINRRQLPSKEPVLVRGEKQPETFAEGKRVYYDMSEILIDEESEEPAF
ncbi:MAG: COP23 domain-containing protein [Crocosphaera sp.]